MELPQGFVHGRGQGKVCKLQMYLFGLKQTFGQWNNKLTQTLKRFRYVQSKNNFSIFTKIRDDKIVVFLVYVVIARNGQALTDGIKLVLTNNFKMKDLGEIK